MSKSLVRKLATTMRALPCIQFVSLSCLIAASTIGYPVSHLDENVFNTSGTSLDNAPILKSFIANPNNIGCHTLGKSEEAFKGSQELEKEVIRVLAVDIFSLIRL